MLKRFLDNEDRIKLWPSKKIKQQLVLEFLIEKFEFEVNYTETEVNLIISNAHTFGDLFLLRRALINTQLLSRENDGSRYWRTPKTDS
ncbi:DUF2087 domain-containing protein [Fusibacter bizertensis]